MEIDRSNFWEKLPTMLKTISEAQYVAVDLEMSGIQVNKCHLIPPVPVQPTLQKAYDDARMIAEMHAILQFGFTCVSWDPKEKSYVTKTYNIPLHPGVVVDNDASNAASKQFASVMDRSFRLSTKTFDFLQDNGFNLLDVFHKGVPYLSAGEFDRKETSDFIEGVKPTGTTGNFIRGLPTKSVEFINGVKDKITNWKRERRIGGRPKPVRVYSPRGTRPNSLQKLLVRELLQEQFPKLIARHRRTRSEGAYMEIFQPSSQTSNFERNQRVDVVYKQIGARLLWDAICGQPFVDKIDPRLVVGDNPIEVIQLKAELKKYEDRLRNKTPVVIGHNILMDLCFLHSKFVAPLPRSLKEFRALTREMMPRIVDTKYLFTRGGDEMSPDYSLGECFAAVRSQELPTVALDPSHSYSEACLHQAGYDSYMTAVVFLKKSYQLSQTKDLGYIASEDLGEGEAPKLPLAPRAELAKSRPHTSPNNLLEEYDENVNTALAKKYGVLQPGGHPTAPATAPPTPEQSPYSIRPSNSMNTFKVGSFSSEGDMPAWRMSVRGMVPEWEGRFWSKYGNRSRVGQFGHLLYIGKMAGEQLPGDKTEKPGTEIFE